jgi:hypothetical protein
VPRPRSSRSSLRTVPKREPTTEELRQAQQERVTEEHEAIDTSMTPDEAHQHERRADKSAYLERMLAKRKRSERDQTR